MLSEVALAVAAGESDLHRIGIRGSLHRQYVAGGLTMSRRAVKLTADPVTLLEAMQVVSAVLEMPRDRLGRLEATECTAWEARERLRELAVRYDTTGSRDLLEQCAKVLRGAMNQATGAKA